MIFEFSALTVLILIGALGLTVQAVIGLGFFVSSIHEHETRATVFGFLQFVAMAAVLVIYLLLAWNGVFQGPVGRIVLYVILASGLVAIILAMWRETNPRAVAGSQGLLCC